MLSIDVTNAAGDPAHSQDGEMCCFSGSPPMPLRAASCLSWPGIQKLWLWPPFTILHLSLVTRTFPNQINQPYSNSDMITATSKMLYKPFLPKDWCSLSIYIYIYSIILTTSSLPASPWAISPSHLSDDRNSCLLFGWISCTVQSWLCNTDFILSQILPFFLPLSSHHLFLQGQLWTWAFPSLCPSYRPNCGPGPAFVLSISSLQWFAVESPCSSPSPVTTAREVAPSPSLFLESTILKMSPGLPYWEIKGICRHPEEAPTKDWRSWISAIFNEGKRKHL